MMIPIKTATFAAVHMTVAFAVVYLMTGSAFLGGAIALIEPLCNTAAYFVHERIWEGLRPRFTGATMESNPLGAAG